MVEMEVKLPEIQSEDSVESPTFEQLGVENQGFLHIQEAMVAA